MIEFVTLSVILGLLLVLAARSGIDHLDGKVLVWALLVAGWTGAVMVEGMPFSSVSAGFSAMTVAVGLAGLFVGRLLYRMAQAWVLTHRKGHADDEEPPVPPRLMHPVIAVGMFLTGVPLILSWTAARHETLEFLSTPRHPETGIVRGAEPISLDPETPNGRAVLNRHANQFQDRLHDVEANRQPDRPPPIAITG